MFSQAHTDTIPYKIGYYEVKKQLKIVELAQKLKVDPEIILKLNRLRSIQRDLVTGLRIKIPIYAKGYKYEPATIIISDKVNAKQVFPKIDSLAQATGMQPKKEKKNAFEPENGKSRIDSIRAEQQKIEKIRASEEKRKTYEPEIDKNNLMLAEATLELNEAMLAGIKASLDTLSKPDPEIINKNDVKEILQRMKRARDRKELKPYLEYMNDSLTLDCNKLRIQKEDILSRLTPYYEFKRLEDSTKAVKQKPELESSAASASISAKTLKKNNKKTVPISVSEKDSTTGKKPVPSEKNNPKQKEIHLATLHDTILVYDLEKSVAFKPAPEKNHKPNSFMIKPDTVQNPANKTVTQKQIAFKKETMWDTARAVIDSALVFKSTLKEIANQKQSTKIITDSIVLALSSSKKTIVTTQKKEIDTIQNIKSQFFLRRAQKAIVEKKMKLAEEYLLKSVELWNDNYDAWMTLADHDASFGSPVKALKEYQECVRIDSTKPKLFYKIGSLYLRSKKKTEAVQCFNKTISIDSDYILAYMDRASIFSDWKKYDEAIRDFDKVLQINKSYHYAYKARGMVKQLNKRFSEAVDDFTRYLIFEETDPSAYFYRGLAKIGNKELLEGCLDLSKSAEMGYDAAEKAIKKSCE